MKKVVLLLVFVLFASFFSVETSKAQFGTNNPNTNDATLSQIIASLKSLIETLTKELENQKKSQLAQVAAPSSGLVARWKFDENSGASAGDSSSNGYTGAFTNNPTWTTGKSGSAVELNGVNAHVSISHANGLNATGDLTLAAWIKRTSSGANNPIITKSTQGVSNYRFRAQGDTICWSHSGGDKIHCTNSLGMSLGIWYHAAIVYNDSANTVKIYLDGVEKYSNSESKSMSALTQPVRIGHDGVTSYFAGAIDDVFVYHQALSLSDIQSIISSAGGTSTPPPLTPTSDTTKPTVSISAPTNGSTVSGSSITVSANATDNIGVVGVQFKLNGNNLGGEDTSSPYSVVWNTTTLANGSHTLSATVRDAAGNRQDASNVTVTVQNGTTAPPPGTPTPISLITGWNQLNNTQLRSVCPPNQFGGSTYPFSDNCRAVTNAWNSGVYDSRRIRMIVLGGGHGDYRGNEIYALNLSGSQSSIARLTDPSTTFGLETDWCPYQYPDGKISSRHTYDGVEYIPSLDKLFYFGGSRVNCGFFAGDTWLFNFSSLQWEKKAPAGTNPISDPGAMTAYDQNTGKIFLHDTHYLYSYDPNNNSYARLSAETNFGSGTTGVIDPSRKKFFIIGKNQFYAYDLGSGSTYARQTITTTGGETLVGATYPGLTYDPTTQSIVGWAGGDTVYRLNFESNTWTPITYPGGPGAQSTNGTYGRFSYIPPLNAFVVVNSMTQNAFLLKVDAPTPTSDTTKPTVSISAPTSGSTVSGSSITVSANATDNIGVVGVQFKLNGNNLGGEDTSSPYSVVWNTTTLANGSHTLSATVRDAAGNRQDASNVTVTVQNGTTAPPPGTPPITSGPLPVGTLTHDGPATPEQISLLLPITGSLPYEARADVKYRVVGSPSWKNSHPLHRIRADYSEPSAKFPVKDAFAWPIIDLTPGTAYEIEVTIQSGGTTDIRTGTFVTRSFPSTARPANKFINVGTTQTEIQKTLDGLVAGDVLEFKNGTHQINALLLNRSGAEGNPIYIRGASRSGTVLQSPKGGLSVQNANYVVIENLTLQGPGIDSGTDANAYGIKFADEYTQKQITVRNINMLGFDIGIKAYSEVSQFMAYDNLMVGNNRWEPAFLNTNLTWNDDGICVPGFGNVAFNNTLKAFGDAFALSIQGAESVGVHYYRNEVRSTGDDFLEGDYAHRNVSFYDNRAHNSATMVSLDPIFGGPFLAARNISINTVRSPFKFNSRNSGHYVYNNTIIKTNGRETHANWGWIQFSNGSQNAWAYRNNILVYHGPGRLFGFESRGNELIDFTHNSWYPDKDIWWSNSGGSYKNLADALTRVPVSTPMFSGSNKRHQNDNITVAQPWLSDITLGLDYHTEVTGTFLPTLANGTSPKNSGVILPNITDNFAGPAPDRGAIISGRTLVTYGDRSGLPIPPTNPPPPTTPPVGDTVAPTISISAPTGGSTVSGSSITVSANATDNIGVVGVQFKLNGNNLGSEDTSSPYSVVWNTTTLANGSHTLSATVRDAAGNRQDASNITVTVQNGTIIPPQPDTTPPGEPKNVSAVSNAAGAISLSWQDSSDNVGILEYEIYFCKGSGCNPTSLLIKTSNLSYLHQGLSIGSEYRYKIRALDVARNYSAYSATVGTISKKSTDTTPITPTPINPTPPKNVSPRVEQNQTNQNNEIANNQNTEIGKSNSGSSKQVITKPLYRGVKDNDVLVLQEFLIKEGLLEEDNKTGFYGVLTEEAVKRFQAKENIVVSGDPISTGYGRVGPKTISKINTLLTDETPAIINVETNNQITSQVADLQRKIQELQIKILELQIQLLIKIKNGES